MTNVPIAGAGAPGAFASAQAGDIIPAAREAGNGILTPQLLADYILPNGGATFAKLSSALTNTVLSQLLLEPDFTAGQQHWVSDGAGTPTWDGSGLHFTYAPSGSATLIDIYNTTGGVNLFNGHRYAWFIDFDASGSGLDNCNLSIFINGASDVTVPSMAAYLGAAQYLASTFDVNVSTHESNKTGNIYFEALGFRQGASSTGTFTLNLTIRRLMLVDLGTSSSQYYNMSVGDIADVLANAGPFTWYPSLNTELKHSYHASKSSRATRATLADNATSAASASVASSLASPWAGKWLLTLGHSLVSQQTWQHAVVSKLGLAGYSMLGITGGTVQPKPLNSPTPTMGFWSRSYMANAVANCVNVPVAGPGTNGASGLTFDATILWTGANDSINGLDLASGAINMSNPGYDRIMIVAEQDEFEARNLSTPSTPLSTALSTGLVPTYVTLWLTLIRNFYDAFSPYFATDAAGNTPYHRLFIVREPQNFQQYDGTLSWEPGHWEKNEAHKKIADMWSIPIIDLWANSGINIWSRTLYLNLEDGGNLMIHTNTMGGKLNANVIANSLLAYPPLDFTGTVEGTMAGFPTTAGSLGPWNVDHMSGGVIDTKPGTILGI